MFLFNCHNHVSFSKMMLENIPYRRNLVKTNFPVLKTTRRQNAYGEWFGIIPNVRLIKYILLLMLCHPCFGMDEPRMRIDPKDVFKNLPRAVSSSGGFVKIYAHDDLSDPVGFRTPVLRFVTSIVQGLAKDLKLEVPRGDARLLVYAMEGRTNDTRVLSKVVRRKEGVQTKIWLPSPGYSDLEKFRFEVAKAFFRGWIDHHADAKLKRRPLPKLPEWVVQGALRSMDMDLERSDTYYVLNIWSNASFPFFSALCNDLKYSEGPAVTLSSYIVSWMKEKHIFTKHLKRLAEGMEWNGKLLAKDLTGTDDLIEQDKVSDERLAKLTRGVLTPGTATPWDLLVFTSRLFLHAPVFGRGNGAMWNTCTFREAAIWASEDPAVREAAVVKMKEMPFCAIGRGAALSEVSIDYVKFLAGVARGDKADDLLLMLNKADGKLNAIISPADETESDENVR